MLKIRLQRFGRKNDPKFRVVLTESKNSTKSGKFLEILGFYNPVQKEKKFEGERIKYWISKGAQVSDTIHNFLVKEKIIEGKTKNVLPSKTPIKKDEPVVEEKPAETKTETTAETPKESVSEVKKEEPKAEKESEPAEPIKEESKSAESVAEETPKTV